MVHPIVVGSGKRVFEDGGYQKALQLVDSKTFSTGVLYLTYQPAQSRSQRGLGSSKSGPLLPYSPECVEGCSPCSYKALSLAPVLDG